MAANVLDVLRVIDSEIDRESSPMAMDDLYRSTVNAFRPAKKTGRGCFKKSIQFHLFLLEKPTNIVPPLQEQRRMTRNGLGSPKLSEPSKTCFFIKCWGIKEVEDYILSLYPEIRLNPGFWLAKSGKNRRLETLNFESVTKLKKNLKKGRLFIIPRSNLSESGSTSTNDEQPGQAQEQVQEDVQILEDDLPVIRRNPLRLRRQRRARTAARVARHQIRNWCNRDTPVEITEEDDAQAVNIEAEPDTQTVNTETETDTRRSMLNCEATAPASQGPVDNLGLTVTQLREQQDRVYERSLETDRMLALSRAQNERREQIQLLQEEQQTAEMNQVLINFIGSVANATKNFTATYLGGPKIMSWMEGKSLADVGIICSCVLEVEWNVDEPVKEQNSYEELMQSITDDTDDIHVDMEDDPSPSR